ncbi:serine/threonine protein phosphatase PrpC [Chryseobacterium defluvii]|uniref:Serine/threonine protein phosphatase PrpC n=1 Tax=Chryseobacterium defluvii TaxID=160396 RepID=A0A840KA56_9FLAO|nr:PP2C family serine/threonine-protein phosphatase [Chryseobacterium defluvii]MBB4806239.1 serine/threonine protein phosphatase PrpC [Chryseobacterium defluvii]
MEGDIRQILKDHHILEGKITDKIVSKLIGNASVIRNLHSIAEAKQKIMQEAIIYKEKEEFKEAHLVMKNANSKQYYEYSFEMEKFPNIRIKSIENLEITGLEFENNTIKGTPVTSNAFNLEIRFFHIGDEGNTDSKTVQLFVNADPKDLWKNIPSPEDAVFYKPEEAKFKDAFLDKKIVVASKRGRSHAHEGTFRDDDFAVSELPAEWSIISVSDGAGSAKMARRGSQLATESINGFFKNEEILNEIEKNIGLIYPDRSETNDETNDIRTEARQNVIRSLYKGILHTYNVLNEAAAENAFSIKDLHSTLIFALVKKFDFGYVILTFGVGDCPINLITSDKKEVKLLNKMDVGEFGGGTRFITMKEIFNDTITSRFGIVCVEDFSRLVLMTDGIYDPKFVTENKLEDMESWNAFFQDLDGNNDDRAKVDFENDEDIDTQLLQWTDFWSRGNHDDRTLAIIY